MQSFQSFNFQSVTNDVGICFSSIINENTFKLMTRLKMQFKQSRNLFRNTIQLLTAFICLICSSADVNECQVHNGGCQHRCVNTRGSYYCECNPGFRLHIDGRTCIGKSHTCLQGPVTKLTDWP